ncbi:hypothetical protein GCM10027046_24670 [Uliginosibacterium flavum]|uniref:Uncharacterized protein n=2 Tax=Uliginosibacterium flavum TaxID=1396831 RepID=A0ABV2TMY6_9RHOO
MSPAIFIGRVISIRPLKTGKQEIEVVVKEVLKGSLPQTIRFNAEGLIDPNEFCQAIENPALPKPQVSEGQEWLILGNFDTATHSLSLRWHGYAVSDETTILKELRQELGKDHKQVQKKAP